ncbi:MAG: class I SAM-dependent methyltransferase [Acholeplasmataceae bacterium]|nr:class I SAM-dependent methyltransferase [Acholeplasmataceae bacterium]
MARSKRITFLAELIKGYNVVLDIGSDHGYVLLEALQKGYITYGIASDLRIEPLMQAEKNLKGYHAKTIQSDGFLNIHESFDLAIIAGMGAYLIGEILDHAPSFDVTYILQANDKPEVLRAYLKDHGFMILDEYVIRDRFDYVVMKVKRGKMILEEKDLILGPYLKDKPEAKPYYERKIQLLSKLIFQVDLKRRREIEDLIAIYQSVL